MPVHANPLLQNLPFLYIKIPKNLTPNAYHQSLCKYTFTCLPLLSKMKVGKHLYTYMTVGHQRQNKMVFECIFQTPNITPETTEAKM